MDIGPEFNDAYEARCETLADLGPVVEHLVQELLRADDIRVHSVRHRVKTKESVQRKVGRKDASYEHLEEIHDLLGLRVITFFPDEVDQVAGVIEAEFSIDHENSVDKRALLDPDRFGYLSRHYVATLDKDRIPSDAGSRLAGLLEIADDEFQTLRNDRRVSIRPASVARDSRPLRRLPIPSRKGTRSFEPSSTNGPSDLAVRPGQALTKVFHCSI